VCCSGLQWVGGPGDGRLETAGRHCSGLQWVGGPRDGRLETASWHCSSAVGYSWWTNREMTG